jgi:thermitase
MTDLHRVRIALALILGLLAFPATAAAGDETRIIVARDAGLNASERADIRADAGVTLAERLPLANTEVVTTDADRARVALRRLNADPDVRYAELDRTVRAFAPGPDPRIGDLWALDQPSDADMDVLNPDPPATQDAWTLGSRGAGHTVAVVDTGVYAQHADLTGRIASGLDFVGEDAVSRDPNGHGTHVTGTIAAAADNSTGIAGVAPLSRILPLRVLRADGGGRTSDVVAAYALAASLGVRVVNASLGSPEFSQAEHDAIVAAPQTLFVVAAGNFDPDDPNEPNPLGVPEYPCRYDLPNVLCVGASTAADTAAAFSNHSVTDVDVFAPGQHILSTWSDAGYRYSDGTSMAAPQVSGIAALLLGKNPDLTPAELRAAVEDVDLLPAFDGKAVHEGRVNAMRALAAVPAPPACTVNCTDPDQDEVAGAADGCPYEKALGTIDGCIAVTTGIGDGDADGKIDRFDQCPSAPGRISDGCPDGDGDGLADRSDACPTVAGALANGCPVPVPVPIVVTPPPPDRDGDGRTDALDACPAEKAATANGCPAPVVKSFAVSIVRWSRRVTLRVRATRAATASFKIERRVCDRRGRNCRWRRVATRRTVTGANVASFTKRLVRGRYRATVTLSSSAGKTAPKRRSFTVR